MNSQSSPPLTAQQAAPLAAVGTSVALEAGAGCGKTTVLTARFLGDLDGAEARPLGSIVALTFTNKAARELRGRIRARCRERLARGADSERWRSVLRGLEAAPIGTFHEFCGQWLSDHAPLAGIDPDFTILDETIAGTIREESLDRSLRQWLAASDDDLIELAVEFGLARVRQALGGLSAGRTVGDLKPWAGRSADEIVEVWRTVWASEGRQALMSRVVRAARRCLECLSLHECTHPTLRQRRAFLLATLPAMVHQGASDEHLGEIREHAKVQGGGKKEHWPAPEIYDQVKADFEDLRHQIDRFLEKSQWDEAATREAAELGRRMARLGLAFRANYAAAKRSRGGLDFDDLQIMTRDLLRSRPELALEIDDLVPTHFLVDEFQDTDPVQGEILQRLGGESLTTGRLFLVGDFRQSIYRFRGAEPGIFDRFRKQFLAAGHHALTENFRSVPAILDFVNALFADGFTESDNRLLPIRKEIAGSEAAVEFLWEPDDENPRGSADPAKARTQARDRRKAEARRISRHLRRRLDAGWLIEDPKSHQPRHAHAGDIALLFSAMTSVDVYESALAREGFDYHVVRGGAFYAQQEVQDMINVLSVIEDPLDAIALAGTLRSPLACVSDDGLYWLATAPFGGLAEGLAHLDEIAELSPLDRSRAERARDLLDRWRGLKDRLPIAALVDRVLDESGYEAALLGEYLGARKRANARKLVRMAREFDRQGGFTVAGFVARLRADLRNPPREEQAATTEEEGTSLRLMSIHQAKGLEFPIVVLADLNRKPSFDHDFAAYHPSLGPLVRLAREPQPGDDSEAEDAGKSLGWLAYQAIEQREAEREALRLFYVAATRARDTLILSAALAADERPASPALALLAERFDRATGRCLVELPTGWTAPEVSVALDCPSSGRAGFNLPSEAGDGRLKPALLEVAEAIAAASVADRPAPPAIRQRPPRFIDLDPALGLSPYLGRLDRLVRAILADPRALESNAVERVAEEAARRQHPAAPERLVGEAIERLRPWIGGKLGQLLAGASAVERGLAWTIAWPPGAAAGTVFQGTIDFLIREPEGEWTALAVALVEAAVPRQRLRLRLAVRAATAPGLGPIRRGWLLRAGPDGEMLAGDRFEDGDIDTLLPSIYQV